jgi:hypothetical protein
LDATILSGAYIVLASPSGLGGLLRESVGLSLAIADPVKDPEAGNLVQALATEFTKKELQQELKQVQSDMDTSNPQAYKQQAIDKLHQAATMVARKASAEEATGLKRWWYTIAERTAQAAKEGSFLGISGERVSEEEKAALQEIAAALGL